MGRHKCNCGKPNDVHVNTCAWGGTSLVGMAHKPVGSQKRKQSERQLREDEIVVSRNIHYVCKDKCIAGLISRVDSQVEIGAHIFWPDDEPPQFIHPIKRVTGNSLVDDSWHLAHDCPNNKLGKRLRVQTAIAVTRDVGEIESIGGAEHGPY